MFPYHYGSHATYLRIAFCPPLLVSIPLWFSRNAIELPGFLLRRMFPYHYGSHATGRIVVICIAFLHVSIPLWFSRNRNRLYLIPLPLKVSIPLWFSRNKRKKIYSNLLCFVSIPLWFSRNGCNRIRRRRRTGVSIPLWFSRNYLSECCLAFYLKFPYHYGSHATRNAKAAEARKRTFPYHYGSHATDWIIRVHDLESSFHTTMVLTQRTES